MDIQIKDKVAVVTPTHMVMDGQSALDLIHAVRYQTGCHAMVLRREALNPDMFRLSSGVAEKLIKPFVDEHMRLVVVGDFYDCYQTNMGTFLFGCNRSKKVGFWDTEEEGIAWLNRT